MKIGILNLPFDNNYGGNLQRYALMVALKRLGHEPIHLNCRYDLKSSTTRAYCFIRNKVQKVLFYLDEHGILSKLNEKYGSPILQAEIFYNKYIEHTPAIYDYEDLKAYTNYEAFIVGSDQVWRRFYIRNNPGQYFFDFLPDGKKRIAYAASIGVDVDDYTKEECASLKPFYRKFSGVSVREVQLIDILSRRGWNTPKAVVALDPTLLIEKSIYQKIIKDNKTQKPQGDLYIYALDMSEEIKNIMISKGLDKQYIPYSSTINTRIPCSIPQWLRNIEEAKCVITDSYHGLVFSIIFNKPYYLIENKKRGVSRFHSLFKLLGLKADGLDITMDEYEVVNKRIEQLREESVVFLKKNLE